MGRYNSVAVCGGCQLVCEHLDAVRDGLCGRRYSFRLHRRPFVPHFVLTVFEALG